jgi:hypothetical protein
MYTYVYTHVHGYVYTYTDVCTYIYLYVCIFIYPCMCTYNHMCICVHIHKLKFTGYIYVRKFSLCHIIIVVIYVCSFSWHQTSTKHLDCHWKSRKRPQYSIQKIELIKSKWRLYLWFSVVVEKFCRELGWSFFTHEYMYVPCISIYEYVYILHVCIYVYINIYIYLYIDNHPWICQRKRTVIYIMKVLLQYFIIFFLSFNFVSTYYKTYGKYWMK